jgi:hypothetical protein
MGYNVGLTDRRISVMIEHRPFNAFLWRAAREIRALRCHNLSRAVTQGIATQSVALHASARCTPGPLPQSKGHFC